MNPNDRLIIFLLITCFTSACAIVSANEMERNAVWELRSTRASSIPSVITPSDRAYMLIKSLGTTSEDNSVVAAELINWIFVKEPAPSTTEPFGLLTVHPAARSLIPMGSIAVPLLTEKLQANISEEDAELILICISRILKDQAPAKIKEIANQTSVLNIKRAANAVYQRKEKRMDAATYRLQQITGD